MAFFFKLYNLVYLRPSLKASLNLFFLNQSASFLYMQLLTPYLFLNTKFLKLKIFKTTLGTTTYYFYFIGSLLLLIRGGKS